MTNSTLSQQLKMCDESTFFEILEKCVQCRVPLQLKKILTINLCNNSIALTGNVNKIIADIEHFMQHDFTESMLNGDETKEDYLGIWADNQKKFQLMSGQKRMICMFVEYCSELYPGEAAGASDASEIGATSSLFEYTPSALTSEGSFLSYVQKNI